MSSKPSSCSTAASSSRRAAADLRGDLRCAIISFGRPAADAGFFDALRDLLRDAGVGVKGVSCTRELRRLPDDRLWGALSGVLRSGCPRGSGEEEEVDTRSLTTSILRHAAGDRPGWVGVRAGDGAGRVIGFNELTAENASRKGSCDQCKHSTLSLGIESSSFRMRTWLHSHLT